jgi:glutamate synthase (NADPH/NADH) small chain
VASIKTNLNYKKIKRQDFKYRKVEDRLKDYKSIYQEYTEDFIKLQASRCQDCGIPFCHGFGCPLSNMIPDFNDLVYKGLWRDALDLLHKTNNFPEITGIVCPALCEESCTMNVGLEPVTIRNIELSIVEKGFEKGWIIPNLPKIRSGKKVAVIGSGPAGLVAAQDLNRKGHKVTVFEKDNKPGGFLRYGIPDFKLEKYIIDRRIDQLKAEGVEFKTNVFAGEDIKANELKNKYDVILLTCGSRESRDLNIEGREFKGVYFAVDYLTQSNKKVDGEKILKSELIDAKDKNVIVIGGGDTGADCIGTARRQGAKNIYQLEILPEPPEERSVETPWPMFAKKLRTSSSHNEGCERYWSVLTKKFIGENGKVTGVSGISIDWINNNGKFTMKEKKGTEFEFKADLVILAMGFTHPKHTKLIKDLKIELDERGNIKTDNFGYGKTNINNVFAAGDASRGASLVVWAFSHAKDVSIAIDKYLRKN